MLLAELPSRISNQTTVLSKIKHSLVLAGEVLEELRLTLKALKDLSWLKTQKELMFQSDSEGRKNRPLNSRSLVRGFPLTLGGSTFLFCLGSSTD